MYFKSNAEYVDEACMNIEDHFDVYDVSEGVVGVFVMIDKELGWVTTMPIEGKIDDIMGAEIDFENVLWGEKEEDERHHKRYLDLGGFMVSDFKADKPSREEMDEIHQKLEKKMAELEKKYHFEKHNFEKCEKEYETVMQHFTDLERGRLFMAKISFLIKGRNNWEINQYDEIWDKLPTVGSHILLWRAGEMQPEDRPYISATYSKDMALRFAGGDEKKIHKILVEPTARLFPMFLLANIDPEKEVLLKTECLQLRNDQFVYK